MSKERLIGLLIKAILEEYMMENVEDLIVYFLRQGIRLTRNVATDLYYEYTWRRRKYIEYKSVKNSLNVTLEPRKLPKR